MKHKFWWRRGKELDDEIQSHMEMAVRDRIERGEDPQRAREAVQREFGNTRIVKETTRDAWGWRGVEHLLQDVRYGARMLLKNPGFTVVAVLTLALGIGATTAIFSVVNGVLLRPLPYTQSDQLVNLYLKTEQSDQSFVPYPVFLYWQRETHTMSNLAAWADDTFDLTGIGMAERLDGKRVSANFLSLFGVSPKVGRDFRTEDDRIGAAPVLLVSEAFWKSRLGAQRNVVGERLTLDGNRYTIIGVVPSSFQMSNPADVYVPIGQSENPSFSNSGPSRVLQVSGRLNPGAALAQAIADMNVIDLNLRVSHPDSLSASTGVTVHTLRQDAIGDLQLTLPLLLGAVGFVMLIACVNVANLLLTRSTARAGELAIRTALGASRSRMMRQLLTESLLLFAIGGALGIVVAQGAIKLGLRLLPAALPRMLSVSIDSRVLIFVLVVSVLTAVLFGLTPALKVSAPNLRESLSESGGQSVTGDHPVRSVLLVVEVSIALVLLTGAGLMIRTMEHLWSVNPGFDPHNVASFAVGFPAAGNLTAEAIRIRNRELEEKLVSVPGVDAVSICLGALPVSGGQTTVRYSLASRPSNTAVTGENIAELYGVGTDYFRVMRIPVREGRVFNSRDDHSGPSVFIIDEQLARLSFPNENPLGKRLRLGAFGEGEIVGIARHVKQFGLDADSQAHVQAQIYKPFDQTPDVLAPVLANQATYVMRVIVPPASIVNAVRQAVSQTDDLRIVYDFEPMNELVANSQSQRRLSMVLLAVFAGIALILAATGIYAVISSLTAQRTNEIGIRMALGAQRGDILHLVIGQAMKMAVVGIIVGIASSFGLTRLIASQLFEVKPVDPITSSCVVFIVVCVTLSASYIPARRAMRVDPMVALRYE